MEEPTIIDLKYSVDDRGTFTFLDEMDFAEIKRFYVLSNHRPDFIRAWHYHAKEAKYVVAVAGSAVVAAVHVDDTANPSRSDDVVIFKTILSSSKPSVLYIPPGYANGAKTITPDTKLLYFSTATLTESVNDDIRYEHDYWNPWEVAQR